MANFGKPTTKNLKLDGNKINIKFCPFDGHFLWLWSDLMIKVQKCNKILPNFNTRAKRENLLHYYPNDEYGKFG